MKIPIILGLIDRRILVNYRVDPAVLAHAVVVFGLGVIPAGLEFLQATNNIISQSTITCPNINKQAIQLYSSSATTIVESKRPSSRRKPESTRVVSMGRSVP